MGECGRILADFGKARKAAGTDCAAYVADAKCALGLSWGYAAAADPAEEELEDIELELPELGARSVTWLPALTGLGGWLPFDIAIFKLALRVG